jgi:hypothetical protein
MKVALIALLLALPAFAQAPSAASTAACGPEKASFDVKLDKSQRGPEQPDPGKALIYFIQDIGRQRFGVGIAALTWVGLDGTWVGANKNNSYFSVSVEPGEHHACSIVRSELLGHPVEFLHFTSEVGKVYYFRARYAAGFLNIDAVDSDEARYLIDTYPQSISQPKK